MPSVSSKHPLYAEFVHDWNQLRHTAGGQRRIKEAGFVYLPATSGMVLDGATTDVNSKGYAAYDAYRKRAVFPELVSEAIEAIVGVMHRKPPKIELPKAMEPMIERATSKGESLHQLLQRVNREQVLMGRVGLLLESPTVAMATRKPTPFIVTYRAEQIINWDAGRRDEPTGAVEKLEVVVLDETESERLKGQFEWETVTKHRVLVLGDPTENDKTGAYGVAVVRDHDDFDVTALVEPTIDGATLDEIPFVFVNTCDVVPEPTRSPTMPLSNLALTIYRGEADYRQSLFMQGQDTLVVIGGREDQEHRVGANASINVPQGGDAKFIGVSSSGLVEQRNALENDYNRAMEMSGKLLDSTSRERESGDALRTRVAARTASLVQIAETGAYALQTSLRQAAKWMGLDPMAVVVKPNLDFTDDDLSGKTVVEIMTAKGLGAPISLQSIHKLMQDRGVTEKTFEEEVEAISEEQSMPEFAPSPTADPEADAPPGDDPSADEAGAGGRRGAAGASGGRAGRGRADSAGR